MNRRKSPTPQRTSSIPRPNSRRVKAAIRESEGYHPNQMTRELMKEYFGAGDESSTGIEITDDSAMSVAAYYAAVGLISASMAVMPVKIYRKKQGGGREEMGDHPANDILGWSPDGGDTTSYMFRETQTAHACMRGNGISEIVRNGRGQAMNAYNLDPRKVAFQKKNGQRLYKITEETGEKVLVPSQVLHIPALSWDGWIGKSPLRLARETLGLAIATEKFGAAFFRKGGRPAGFLTKPNNLNTTQRDNLRQEWKELHEGIRNFLNVGVLSGGLGWQQVGVNPDEAQFLLTRKFQVEEIARWFRIPPHMLASMDNAKYNNVEQMLLEFMIFTLFPWIKRWEGELNLKLFTAKEAYTYYAEFNFDALLRADTKTKYEAMERQVKAGLRTLDELRELDNQDPYPDGIGSKPLVMGSQMVTLEDLIAGKVGLTAKGGSGTSNPPQTDQQAASAYMSKMMGMVNRLCKSDLEDLKDVLDIQIRRKTREQVEKERSNV